jgi:flagellar protein FlaG
MNYDLFIAPQFLDRAASVASGSTARDEPSTAPVLPRSGTIPVDEFVGSREAREISSDENNSQKVQEAVELVNRVFDRSPVDLNLSVDNDTETVVIKLIERESRKVIRQIPPDEILRLRQHLQELLGVVFDETV